MTEVEQNNKLKEWLIFSAKPIIKGKLTKGKLRWRGIKMIKQKNRVWIEQRGKRITPFFYDNKTVYKIGI